MKFSTLSRSGRQSAKWRGHDMPPLRTSGFWKGHLWYAECRHCGANLSIRPKPAPNEIDVGGEAVALNCKASS